MLLLTASLLAGATPPPPSAPGAPHATGFDRLYVDPAAFGARLLPEDLPPAPPRPRATLTLTLDEAALDEAELEVEAVQVALEGLDGAADVRLDTDGTALVWTAPSPTLPRLEVEGHALGDLGALRAFPPSWTRQPVPTPVRADLSVTNDTMVRVEVVLDDTRVGALLPGATGTLHQVRAGRYSVELETPDGFRHVREVRTVTPARAPDGAR